MKDGRPRTAIVVPCFNEGARLKPQDFLAFLEGQPDAHLVLVDDGSSDGTWEILEAIRSQGEGQVTTLRLDENRGKAEAVRRGVLHILGDWGTDEGRVDFLGYWDADLSTPLAYLPLFLEAMEELPYRRLVMGSRVKLLGRHIVRKPLRHYTGRVFATLASLSLDLPVYDTQCGAKLFRADWELEEVFSRPFSDPWIFDVEILARLRQLWGSETESRVFELPLPSWEHMGGSKVRLWHGLRAAVGLCLIWIRRARAER